MYTQITQEERYRIAELRGLGLSIRGIAAELSRSPSTVSRETWREVVRLLRLLWSPEQIAGHLSTISHETIYVHIWKDKKRGARLRTHLRQASGAGPSTRSWP